MTKKNGKRWAAMNRRAGESHDSWVRRNHEYHRRSWVQDKNDRGEWLPADEFEKFTGRPGRETPLDAAAAGQLGDLQIDR